MKNTDRTIDDFRKGNSEQRLSLFLQYSNLRSAFENIEKEESKTLYSKAAKSQQGMTNMDRTTITPFRQLIRWCYSLMSW